MANPIQPPFDCKLGAIVNFANTPFKHPEVKTQALASVVKAFRFNVARTKHLMIAYPTIASVALHLQQAFDQAAFDVTGSLPPKSEAADASAVLARFHAIYGERQDQEKKLLGTDEWDNLCQKRHEEGLFVVSALADGPGGFEAVHANFAAIITSSWTTIESVAGDLWEESLNAHPETLASLSGAQKSKEDTFYQDEKAVADSQKQIQLHKIAYYNYDIKNKMGSILRHRFEFSRLSNFRNAYSAAFSKDNADIIEAINDKSFDILVAVRNLFVHSSGFADGKFIQQARKLGMTDLEEGTLMRLDGETVASIVGASLSATTKLIEAVDAWLQKHA